MKKFLSLCVVLTVLTGVVNANDDKPKSPVGMAVVKSSYGFKLFYQGAKRNDIKVTIYDSKGQVVHKETLHRLESFVRPYNLVSLGNGEYTVEVVDENGKRLQKLDYTVNSQKKMFDLVKLKGASNRYMLRVASKGSDELSIRIFQGRNTLVYSATEKIDGNFARIYTLDKVGSDFVFEITDKNGITQTITY